jgi:COP9 signalosome complex subunit 7
MDELMTFPSHYLSRVKSAESVDELLGLLSIILNDPTVYVFGELFDLLPIQNLANTHPKEYKILEAFAFGGMKDIPSETFQSLSTLQQQKLRLLTVVSLSFGQKVIPYDLLLRELSLTNVRELEDLIIEGMSKSIIHGKLDQRAHNLIIDEVIGRDVPSETELDRLFSIITEWRTRSHQMIESITKETSYAQSQRNSDISQSHMLLLQQQEIINRVALQSVAGEDLGIGERMGEKKKKRTRDQI